jgi:predicted protein tyrosine phosphatase
MRNPSSDPMPDSMPDLMSDPVIVIATPLGTDASILVSGTPGLVVEDDGGLTLDEDRLADDMASLAAHGVRMLVGLVEDEELGPVAYEDISDAAARAGIRAWRFPISDFRAPTAAQEPDWQEIRAQATRLLEEGQSVAFHCLAGIGRSGMMAARLLTDLGLAPDEALSLIRRSRPEALETDAQLAYLRAR